MTALTGKVTYEGPVTKDTVFFFSVSMDASGDVKYYELMFKDVDIPKVESEIMPNALIEVTGDVDASRKYYVTRFNVDSWKVMG